MKDMGCNAIRLLNTNVLNKELLRDLYKKYGIKVLICDPLGAYTVHSGADWKEGTDYSSKTQCGKMKEFVRKTVLEYKDEEWVLGYILGNENNMPGEYMGVNASRTRANSQPRIYAEFLNEVAAMVRQLDPDHIVGVGNMQLGLIEYYAKYAPELDFIGVNEYPGSSGFGSLWIRARATIDRPILMVEFGCDAYATGKGPDEDAQANYIKNGWEDIVYNSAGNPGAGNSIGGMVFEWLDEWWKDTRGDPLSSHSEEPTFEMAFPDGFSQEEWLGIVGQGNGSKSPFLRQPRKAYYALKDLWTGQ
jgi:beta-galactosidase